MTAVPSSEPEMGHQETVQTGRYFRFPLDLDRTIEAIEMRLNDQRVPDFASRSTALFRSASEICDVDLYPKSTPGGPAAPLVANWTSFWNAHAATGDNLRERAYAHIYPRLTTKSNVYTVHMRCQVIRKAPGTPANVFDAERDTIAGEYRGSATIERFIDPNDPDLLKYEEESEKVDPYYRFRIISAKHFAPY
jgi:hypothetical protein